MDYARWAKDNKKRLVKTYINRFSAEPHNKSYAVFAAGIPGAGKTEFLDRLFSKNDVVRIDLDEIVKLFPDYKPENYYTYRGAANIILDEILIYCRKQKLNFVLDGTFGHNNALSNIEKALKRHEVLILYIHKNPKAAWQLTQERQLVTKRGVDRNGFIDACLNVPSNVKQAKQMFKYKIEVIVIKKNAKDYGFKILRSSNEIDDLLAKTYTRTELERAIP